MMGYPRRRNSVVWKIIDRKGILLHLDSGEYFEVDPVGLFIWERCSGRAELQKIAEEVASRFGVTQRRAEGGVADFVSDLKRKNLLEVLETLGEAAVDPKG